MLGFNLWKVSGESMSPQIPGGSFVLTCKRLPLFSGAKLVFKHASYGLIVKTLIKQEKSGLLWCKGESTSSVSVEQIGPVAKSQVLGCVLWVFRPSHPR